MFSRIITRWGIISLILLILLAMPGSTVAADLYYPVPLDEGTVVVFTRDAFKTFKENYRIAHNIFWDNFDCDVAFGYEELAGGWSYAEELDFTGVDGNLYADPMLLNDGPLVHLTSPCIDNGDPQYADLDGTPSDIGARLTIPQ